MTKEEFLDEIKKEFGFMPYEEVIKAEKYFESYFNGSEPDEKVIERFGSSKYAAQNYYRTHVANSNANIKPPKKNGVGIWALIIILILLSPILIPLAIVIGFFAVAIIFGILCIFPFTFFSGVSMWLGGAGMILKSFFCSRGICEYGYANRRRMCIFRFGTVYSLGDCGCMYKTVPMDNQKNR